MVTTVNHAPVDYRNVKRPPLVAELVGPAGAGKTTLCQALKRHSESILVSYPPFVRSVADSPFFVRHGLLILPTLFRLYKNNDRCLTLQEIAWIAILNGWHHLLRRGVANDRRVVVLDQGPVFLLAQLLMVGPESLRNRSANKWWKGMYRQWAATLNIIIYLDASDTHLLERTSTRRKWHVMKEMSEEKNLEFLACYRETYKNVMSILTANHSNIKVLRFDTVRESVGAIVKRLLVEFGLEEDGEAEVV